LPSLGFNHFALFIIFIMKFDISKPFWFADYGSRFHVVKSNEISIYKQMEISEFVDLAGWMGNVRQLVCESAHLETHRSGKSLAQPLTEEVYGRLIRNALDIGVVVRSAPEGMTPKIRDLYPKTRGKEKKPGQDRLDCEAWISYLQETERQDRSCLSRPKQYSATYLSAIHEFKDRTNRVLNWVRCFETNTRNDSYKFLPDEIDGLKIKTNFIGDLIRESGLHETANCPFHEVIASNKEQMEALDYIEKLRGVDVLKYKQIFTLGSMVLDAFTGEERVRVDTGKPPNARWLLRHIVGFTPRHRRGGVGRSNIMHHGYKHYVAGHFKEEAKFKKRHEYSPEEVVEMKERGKEYRAACNGALRLLRDTYRKNVKPANPFYDPPVLNVGKLRQPANQCDLFV
tara:strand:+ start:81 stop:1277 length:1197 start_codon:yes stop_codon:yes gene_type:complete